MIEVTKDDNEVAEEYNYDQEEFDEYEDEDFDSSSGSNPESSDDVRHVKPPPSLPTESDRLDLMQVYWFFRHSGYFCILSIMC